MPIYFQRPENALKRANEFIEVGKKEPALDVLYDVIKSKKHRTWQKIHEPILFKYLELCVDLRRSHVAKEGLYQYRLICQHVNVNSLECVIRHFLQLAEDRASRAQGESRDQVVVDDLDNIQTPESVLLSFVSGEDVQDRTDRIMLTPWLKFLWEAYRNVLELLRNNIRVEKLYHETAQQAFKFCLNYTRRTEFRKLCDNIRNHLTNIMKHHGQPNAINLSNPDTLQMHLETRLAQLDSAVNMELWQEAFKAVEDIHGLMQLSKKHPKPQVMANYYQKVALVFWKAENYLFHAAALQKLLVLSREQKKTITPEEVKRMASKVLLATLSVPIPPPSSDSDRFLNLDDISREKIKRLSVLLGLQGTPSRQLLIKELIKMNVIQFALPELQDLFHWLEEEFHPLQLCSKVSNVLDFLTSTEDLELSQYVRPIQRIAVMRVLKQASQVYQNIQFSHLLKMIPFVSEFELEQIVVDAAKDGSLQVRLDHRTKSVSFGTDLCVGNLDGISEGPHLQAMTSEKMHSQLILMSQALQKAMRIIKPSPLDKDRDELREHLVQSYLRTARKEHQQTMQRKVIIEARKEHQENIHNERERREHQEMERQRQKALEAERKRLEEEARVREQQRKQRELMEIEKKQALEKINALKKTTIGARALKDLTAEEIEDMDADDIIARQVEQLDRDKKEMQTRLKSQEKRVDYLARALRQEEIPLLKKQYNEQLIKDKEFWEKEEDERITAAVTEHDKALTVKEQLGRMVEDKDIFVKILQEKRQAIYKDQLKAFNEDLEAKRKERLEKRRKQRLLDRKQKFLRDEEEALRREQEEKRRKEEEEKKQKEKEEKEAKEREYKEYLAKLEEQSRKQREREQEIEEKMRKKTEEPGGVIEQREPGWRDDRGPPRGRDDRDFGGRDDRRDGRWGPPRDGPPRDGPPRDGPPRDGPPRDGPPRDAWRRGDDGPRGPPPEDRGWRRGGGDSDDRPPPWRPRGGRDDDDRGPGRDDRGWRSRGRDDDDRGPPPGRDDWRSRGRDDDRGPPREDRPAWRSRGMDDEDRGPPKDDRTSAWRGRGRDDERGPPPRDDRDGRGPPPGDDRPPAWRPRGGDRDDSGPPPREDRWRRDDDRGPPPRDGPGWRRDRDDRGPPPRGEDRWRSGPDDRERGPGPGGRWGDRDGGDREWRKGRDDDQGRRDDDRRGGGPWRGGRDDDRDRPGRWGDRGGDRGSWRERTDERPAMKDDRDMGRREPPKEAGRSWQAARVRRNETDGSDGDGWTVVEKK